MPMTGNAPGRAHAEIAHGRFLSMGDPEATWGWGSAAGRRRAERRAALILQGAQIGRGDRVLEVGCGTGLFTSMFARSGAEIVAVDISDDLLERARQRGLPNARFIARPFEQCDVEGPFEAVIGSSVLHHLDIGAALANIARLLKPGGRLSFAEPNYLNPQVFSERTLRFLPMFSYVSPDETAFVRWTFRTLLVDSGFEQVEITPFDWLHPATPPALVGTVEAVGGALERTPIIKEFAGSLVITARRPS